MEQSLREKCPNTEVFMVLIFLYLVQIQENKDREKLRIWTLFTQWIKKLIQEMILGMVQREFPLL